MEINKTKQCFTCQKRKSLNEFYKNKRNKGGRSGNCKACRKEYEKHYAKSNPIKIKLRKKIYYEKYKKEIIKKTAQWVKNNPEKVRRAHRKWDRNKNNRLKKKEYMKKNPKVAEKCRINTALQKKINIKNLSDGIIKGYLCQKCNGNNLNQFNIPQELIEAKRLQIQIFRLVNLMKEVKNMKLGVEEKKQCSICQEIKSLEEFHIDKNRKDKRHLDCKKCKLRYEDQRRKTNGYEIKKELRNRYKKDKNYRAHRLKENKIWRENNREKVKSIQLQIFRELKGAKI